MTKSRPRWAWVATGLAAGLAGCAGPQGLAIKDMGSFHVGGREHTISGQPVRSVVFNPGGAPAQLDPNGVYQVEQMYVQYFVPQQVRGKLPLLMWHGGGLTGVTYETTPDGRPGWLQYFIRQGWTVYNSDAVERGRSSWAMYPDVFKTEPIHLTKANPFERFRIGDGPGSYHKDPARMKLLPGNQFPPEGYDNFTKQVVPRWTSTDAPTIAAYAALLDKVGPSIVVAHSQGGQLALRAAQARPDKVKALVLVEPAGIGDTARAAVLKDIPIVAIFGDYIDKDSRWPTIKRNVQGFLAEVDKAGGKTEVVDLPALGIRGNSHMMMMDRNSDEVAGVIQRWLAGKGFTQ